jgi:hypothetical protein
MFANVRTPVKAYAASVNALVVVQLQTNPLSRIG